MGWSLLLGLLLCLWIGGILDGLDSGDEVVSSTNVSIWHELVMSKYLDRWQVSYVIHKS